jgi:ankyrin repeat protein
MLRKCLKFFLYVIVAFQCFSVSAGAYEDFFQAIERDEAAQITALLRSGFDPNTRDEKGQVGLFLAMRQDAQQAAEALWGHPGLDLEASNNAGETPLMRAALRGRLDWARRLLDRGAQPHRDGWSPLHYAATGPEPRLVALLLARGAPVDARSPNGSTPLMMAARYGSEDSVQVLLKAGANPRLRNDRDLGAADFARAAGRGPLATRLENLAR